MKARVQLSEWRSADAERVFHEREDDLVGTRLTERPVAIDVETRLGPTRVYSWASRFADPTGCGRST